jgi:hypothetical protein
LCRCCLIVALPCATSIVTCNVYVLLPAAQPPQGRGGQKEEGASASQGRQAGGLSPLHERPDTGAEQTLRKAAAYPIGQSRRGGFADSQVLSICKYVNSLFIVVGVSRARRTVYERHLVDGSGSHNFTYRPGRETAPNFTFLNKLQVFNVTLHSNEQRNQFL